MNWKQEITWNLCGFTWVLKVVPCTQKIILKRWTSYIMIISKELLLCTVYFQLMKHYQLKTIDFHKFILIYFWQESVWYCKRLTGESKSNIFPVMFNCFKEIKFWSCCILKDPRSEIVKKKFLPVFIAPNLVNIYCTTIKCWCRRTYEKW